MKITFYHYKDDDITINTDIVLEDGKLLFDGFDSGKRVGEIRGISDDYEYKLSLDEENTAKLFKLLDADDKTDEEKLNLIKERFGREGSTSEFSEFCDKNGIKTEFFCWP